MSIGVVLKNSEQKKFSDRTKYGVYSMMRDLTMNVARQAPAAHRYERSWRLDRVFSKPPVEVQAQRLWRTPQLFGKLTPEQEKCIFE